MRLIHKIMLLIPICLVWMELFCVVFLVKTDFWKIHYKTIDAIDTLIVGFCGLHFIFFHFLYTRISRIYLGCIYSIVILNFLYIYLTDEIYYFLYCSIVLTYILLSFGRGKNSKRKA